VEINFSVNEFHMNDVQFEGKTMKSVGIPGVFLPNDAGNPDLAGTGRYIAIPQGASATYRIVSYRTEILKNIEIAPAPVLPLDNDPSPLKYFKNLQVYSKNSYYPENPVILSGKTQIRGVDVVMLGITPFQYNPVSKELIIYKDLKVEVNFTGGNGHFGDDAYRNRWWEPILDDALLNYISLPKIDFDSRYKNIKDVTGYEYVIISPDGADFLAWADTIKNFRIAQGIKTGVYKLTDLGGNTVTAIKNWVTNAYNTWTLKPVAICLLGDYGSNINSTIISTLVTHPAGYPAFASDNYYSDVNGDEMPEIVFSRIIANNASQLQILISKNLKYERTPPTSAYFYSHPITALGWQTERWFQICSEVLGGFFSKSLGKTPTRINAIYSGNPSTVWSTATNTSTVVSYFGPAGRYYIPLTPDSLGNWSGGTATMVNNAINSGAFLLQHRDHGMYTGWGEPAYTTSNISSLTNTDLSFIYSINCQTGGYHNPSGCPSEGSFVEVFYRYTYNGQNSGALGMVCPTEVSYSFVNDTYCWGMYDNMWPQFMPDYGGNQIPQRDLKPAFGMASGKYFLQQSSWPYNTGDKLVTYRLYHMHGDAFLNLYSTVPQSLTVSHASTVVAGATTFQVTANSGALIALSYNGEVFGTGTGTGSPVTINIPGTQLPGNNMKVVVTKQNYYRYENNVAVVPSTGPYVVYDSVAINDASPLGNGNGKMDYGETNQLSVRVKNVGSAIANNVNVKVTTTDSYITMTDSTENYGTINAGATKTITNGFAYTVNNLIPDNRIVTFNVAATDGTNNWASQFTITAHAPEMKMRNIQIVDSLGNNNGKLDPGENVRMYITFKNTGTSNANSVVGRLFDNSSYITVNGDSLDYGTINYGDSIKKFFNVSALSSTPIGTIVKFTVNMKPALRNVAIDSFNVTVGQNNFIIGNGTISCNFPFTTYWMDGRTDILFLASELTAAGCFIGNISKIGFNVITADPAPMNGFNVKIQNTTLTSITGFTTTGWTTCYSGTYTVPGTGWQLITLQTPFYWNGTSNVLIEICYNNSAYTQYSPVYASSAAGMYYGRYGDLSSGDGCATTSWSSTTGPTGRPNLSITMTPGTGIGGNLGVPTVYNLSQNYPNPFNPTTKIEYAIPKQGFVSIKIYDLLGREISSLVNEVKQAGYYFVDFNGSNLASGVYFYKMESNGFTDTKKFILMK
jgi:hypothetical protein